MLPAAQQLTASQLLEVLQSVVRSCSEFPAASSSSTDLSLATQLVPLLGKAADTQPETTPQGWHLSTAHYVESSQLISFVEAFMHSDGNSSRFSFLLQLLSRSQGIRSEQLFLLLQHITRHFALSASSECNARTTVSTQPSPRSLASLRDRIERIQQHREELKAEMRSPQPNPPSSCFVVGPNQAQYCYDDLLLRGPATKLQPAQVASLIDDVMQSARNLGHLGLNNRLGRLLMIIPAAQQLGPATVLGLLKTAAEAPCLDAWGEMMLIRLPGAKLLQHADLAQIQEVSARCGNHRMVTFVAALMAGTPVDASQQLQVLRQRMFDIRSRHE